MTNNNDSRKAFDAWWKDYMNRDPKSDTTYDDAAFYPYKAWQAAQQHFLKMLESEEMVEVVSKHLSHSNWVMVEDEAETFAQQALSAIKAKLGAV